jgi:hypothetical protein
MLFALASITGGVGAQVPASPGQIYIVDFKNDRIVRVNDMTGTGWTTLGT